MRVTSLAEVEALVADRIPEGPSLEYKEALSLGTRRDRIEMLKDLTGMGNGGGGAVIFGVAEDPNDERLIEDSLEL
jgi:hypothetical protein